MQSAKDQELEKAFWVALRYLNYCPRGKLEVEKKLTIANFPKAVIKKVIKKLEAIDYINDLRLAQAWVSDRNKIRPKGKRVLRAELLKKGIADEIIERVLADIDLEAELELVKKLVAKKFQPDLYPDALRFQKARKKTIDFLLRRGFSFDTIKEAMKEVTNPTNKSSDF